MPTDQALSLSPQTKLNDVRRNHDKDWYSVPTGFWEQGYWGEGSAESIRTIQKVNDELDQDEDSYSVPTGFWNQGYWGERSTESIKKNRHGSRGRKVREPPLRAPFAPHRQPFATTLLMPPALEQS